MRLGSFIATFASAALLSLPAFAASTTGTVSAQVIENITVLNLQPLNFGFITPNGAGSVTVSTNNQRTTTGGVQAVDTFSRATFKVEGTPGRNYTINVPASTVFTGSNPAGAGTTNQLTVSSMVTKSVNSGDNNTGQLNGSGQDTIYLGGTISVPANAVPGVYSGTVNLTVSY